LDTGATDNFFIYDGPYTNNQSAKDPIEVILPNDQSILSTHTADIPIPQLPLTA